MVLLFEDILANPGAYDKATTGSNKRINGSCPRNLNEPSFQSMVLVSNVFKALLGSRRTGSSTSPNTTKSPQDVQVSTYLSVVRVTSLPSQILSSTLPSNMSLESVKTTTKHFSERAVNSSIMKEIVTTNSVGAGLRPFLLTEAPQTDDVSWKWSDE